MRKVGSGVDDRILFNGACGAFVLLAGSASAQSEDMKAMAQQFGQSAKQNATALRMYAWQMRVEITLKGDPQAGQAVRDAF